MWIHKNEEELVKIKRMKKYAYWHPRRPFFLAAIFFFVACLDIKLGFEKYRGPAMNPITWDEFFETGLPSAFILGLIAFLLIYAWQLIFKRTVFSGRDTAICLKCNKAKVDDRVYDCDCGGKFVPLDELEWVPDKKDASNKS